MSITSPLPLLLNVTNFPSNQICIDFMMKTNIISFLYI